MVQGVKREGGLVGLEGSVSGVECQLEKSSLDTSILVSLVSHSCCSCNIQTARKID